MENTIGSVPEFTQDEGEEVKEADVETSEVEKETPAELPAVETPVEPESESVPNVDTGDREKQGLLQERDKLLREIQALRGQRREIKQDQLVQVSQKIDELNDVNPQDVSLIEKVIRSKGYITKPEAEAMSYKAIEQDEISKFLDKFPEYKPENDPNDLNWGALQRQFSEFARPSDPRRIGYLLEKSHKFIAPRSSDRSIPEKKQQLRVAGVGSGGTQRSSSNRKNLDPDTVSQLRAGGFTDEDIQKMESRL